MTEKEKTLLLVSGDEKFCARMKYALKKISSGCGAVELRDGAAARKFLFGQRVELVVFDVPGSAGKGEMAPGPGVRLDAAVTSLAVHAPVIVIGKASQRREMKALMAAGVVDFVERGKK